MGGGIFCEHCGDEFSGNDCDDGTYRRHVEQCAATTAAERSGANESELEQLRGEVHRLRELVLQVARDMWPWPINEVLQRVEVFTPDAIRAVLADHEEGE